MSESGPSENSSRVDATGSPGSNHDQVLSSGDVETIRNMSDPHRPSHDSAFLHPSKHVPGTAPIEMRVHFDDFAAQLRSHRHGEYKRQMLEHRRTQLQKAVALSGRLRRLTSWLHDGLVEISRFPNTADFVRVHEHLLSLTDVCFSRWSTDIRAYDTVTSGALPSLETSTFLSKLSPSSQTDCLDFIRNVRSNPRFLIERFKAVSPSQLVALSTAPRYNDLRTYITPFSGSRGRSSQKKRIQSYAKTLEGYAMTFERKNPMSFLLHNCYAVNSTSEDYLRIQTWSTICASLYTGEGCPFLSFFNQILWEFSGLFGWRARDRLELFLMDILQRGAFLLEPIGDIRKGALDNYIADTLEGDQARTFFNDAIRELFNILCIEDGGFPQGVLDLVRAMLGKVPDEGKQGKIRGYVFFDWFLQHFLRNAIEYPENQKMLLQFHVSDQARSTILRELWKRANARAGEAFDELSGEPNEGLRSILYSINNQLYTVRLSEPAPEEPKTPACISICSSDLIHTLEALSQQYTNVASHFEPFMQYTASAFQSNYSRTRPKLDKLRRELQLLFEPGHPSTSLHAIDEHWILVPLLKGQPQLPPVPATPKKSTSASVFDSFTSLNSTQRAAIRLALEDDHDFPSPSTLLSGRQQSLQELISIRVRHAKSSADTVDANFWNSALEYLDENYPLAATPQTESRVLRPLVAHLRRHTDNERQTLENQVAHLEREYQAVKDSLVKASKRIEHLKLKLWYVTSVVVSGVYENAQNITKALAYMWLPSPPAPSIAYSISSGSRDRPGTSTSTTSSLFEQPRLDTMKILKAPKEYGGPKKLADEQVELTKRWLERNEIDNFCKGEERIHRFCMEIKMATRRLVAESAVESPDLWSSDLWAKEKNSFESSSIAPHGIAISTRASSVISEAPSSAVWGRPILGSTMSSRSFDADVASSPGGKYSAPGYASSWMHHAVIDSDLPPSFAAPARSMTATSGESVWSASSPFSSQTRSQTSASLAPSLWSQSSVAHPSRSQTSASLSSRPPSIFNDVPQFKPSDTSRAKAQFLDTVREGLTVLLLSDLGNPVWSLGSETDAWLDSHRRNPNIAKRTSRRQELSELLPLRSVTPSSVQRTIPRAKEQRRSWSADDTRPSNHDRSRPECATKPDERALDELDDVLKKVSRQVNPNAKLQAVHQFRQLAVLCLERQVGSIAPSKAKARRQSLESGISVSKLKDQQTRARLRGIGQSEKDIRDYLRNVLNALEPKTLFRDLQYVAAFASLDALNKTESGKAFVQVGLAALSNKDEVCRAMVELAYQIMERDNIKRRASVDDAEYTLNKARDYWIIAAKEGIAVAQRELAFLYLAHPEVSVPPMVTAPLSMAGEVFTNKIVWSGSDDARDRPALRLARHWLQLAAAAGDPIAIQKLEELKGKATK